MRTLLIVAMLLVVTLDSTPASALWVRLARSERYEVALDTSSVRLTTSGKQALWLKFIPRGESWRKMAAVTYNNKEYRLHMEYYEIDCDNNNAVKGVTYIIGPAGKRLGRITGSGPPEIIIPGSVLEHAAKQVCPVVEENKTVEEDASDESASIDEPRDDSSDGRIAAEAQQRVTIAVQRTEAEPANHAAWVELGNACYDADMPRQAIEAYNRALALKPDDPDVLNDQGAMFRQTGDVAQALRNFERALVIAPDNLESLYNSGYIYAFDLHDIDHALEIWRRFVKLDSSSETARQVQSFIERYGHPEPVRK